MRYVSITPEEKRLMLKAHRCGSSGRPLRHHSRKSPAQQNPGHTGGRLRNGHPQILPFAGPEERLRRRLRVFSGGGGLQSFYPTLIDSVISRSEFYTSYTPYQPEVSQGTLQATFEFQTLICQLTGMEVANASLYDGGSALAEGVLMAVRTTRRQKVLVAQSVHPEYRRVLETYAANLDIQLQELPFTESGCVDVEALERLVSEDHAAVVIQSPNFFGVLDDVEQAVGLTQSVGALSVVVVSEALSLGLLKPPGELGADIVVGEGQSLGIPLGFGGPYLGLFASKDKYKRQMPGRLVGQTVDSEGRQGYVLTLATREQHIRRQKATSNICTNQGLCALVATVFLSVLGKQGIRELAEQNLKKAFHLRKLLGDSLVFSGATFNEMVVECSEDPADINRQLVSEGIIGGLPLGRYFPERSNQMLVCVTEQNSLEKINRLAEVLSSVKVTL